MDDLIFVFATTEDEHKIKELLLKCRLHINDIDSEKLKNFILAKVNSKIVGVVGLEIFNDIGLLRSLAVEPSARLKGIGKLLLERIFTFSYQMEIKELFLFTTDADKFFICFGFNKLIREKIPVQIRETSQYNELCPDTAFCMSRKTDEEAIYFPSDILFLQPVIEGANMWSVFLKRSMITYFEIEPNCNFKLHSHESEQITMVLEGVLYVEVNNKVIEVKKGEVIAIPSNQVHAACTKKMAVKAIDAWSPVREKYKYLKLQKMHFFKQFI